jgi:hypothetical protein
MNKTIAALGALLAATVLVPDEALARPGGFGGGGGRAGGFGGGMRAAGGFHGGMGGLRGGMIRHGGFRGTAVRIHPGWSGRARFEPGFRGYGRYWGGRHFRYGYRRYDPFLYGGALSAGALAASYGYYDYPYLYAASPYYGGYPYPTSSYEPSCPLLIRRVVGPNKRVVIRRRYLCP